MQAIQTKYLPATGSRNARIKATAGAGSIIPEWDHDLSLNANHRSAAVALTERMGWNTHPYGDLASGCLADGSWVHVMLGRDGQGDWR
jgi:hypothetical protein